LAKVTSRALAAAKRTTAAPVEDESVARRRVESRNGEVGVAAAARAAHGPESTVKPCADAMNGVVITAQTTKAILNTPDGRGIICAESKRMTSRHL
jgi:hypothetical protein